MLTWLLVLGREGRSWREMCWLPVLLSQGMAWAGDDVVVNDMVL